VGSCEKITELAQMFGLLFPAVKVVYLLVLAAKRLGYILGDFLETNFANLHTRMPTIA
jgi:hypothetical protein